MKLLPRFLSALMFAALSLSAAAQNDKRLTAEQIKQEEAKFELAKQKEPNNPEVWVKHANVLLNAAYQEVINLSSDANPKGGLVFQDKNGNTAGSLGSRIVWDKVLSTKAMEVVTDAANRFPQRVDIWFGALKAAELAEQTDAQFAVLQKLLAYLRTNPKNLEFKGKPVPTPYAEFFPDNLQNYLTHYWEADEAAYKKHGPHLLRMAQAIHEAFPKHPYPITVVGGYYASTNNYDKALEAFLKANQNSPKDFLVLMNIARIHSLQKNIPEARKLATQALNVTTKNNEKRYAENFLDKLPK